MYPQCRFPYERLVEENARRGRLDPEYELVDTGIFADGRYFEITVDYAKAARRTSWSSSRCATWGRNRRTSTCSPPSGSATPGRGTPTTTGPRSAPRAAACGRRTTSSAAAASTACRAPSRSLRQRDQRAPALGRRRARLPEGRHQRPRRLRGADRAPGQARDQGRSLVSAQRRRGRDGDRCGCAFTGARARGPRAGVHRHHAAAAPRGGRVLRRTHAGRPQRRRGGGDAPGLRGDALGQAVLPLRRRALAGRRPRLPAPSRGAPRGPQPRLAAPRQPRRHLHARQVGVPVVRRLGPGLPLRRPGPRRPRAGQEPADPDLPRVVHAPQRPAPRLRMGPLGRQPAGARLGGAARLRDRGRRGFRLPGARVPQAGHQLHLVGEPQGRRGAQRLLGRVPGAGQHRPLRPLRAAAGGGEAGAVGRHRLDGDVLPGPAGDRAHPRRPRRHLRGRRHQVLRALHPDRGGDEPSGAVGRGGRLLLRHHPRRRWHRHPDPGALDGRDWSR